MYSVPKKYILKNPNNVIVYATITNFKLPY